jgi:GT2 family glycosyltransferase
VIDNGSTDGSAYALRSHFGERIKVIENKANLGYARGFNVGLRYSFVEKGADYCLVMNNDTIIGAESIRELVKVAQFDSTIGFVTGKVYYYDDPSILQTVGKEYHPVFWNGSHIGNGEKDLGQYDSIRELHFADDIFTLVSRYLYETVGGYNPLFFLESEEYDWQARAKSAGYRILYTPHAKLWHRVSMTLGKDSVLKAYYDARNPLLVILLNKSPEFFKKYMQHYFSSRILRSSLVYLKHGRFSAAYAKWQGFCSAIAWGIRNRKFKLQHFL